MNGERYAHLLVDEYRPHQNDLELEIQFTVWSCMLRE